MGLFEDEPEEPGASVIAPALKCETCGKSLSFETVQVVAGKKLCGACVGGPTAAPKISGVAALEKQLDRRVTESKTAPLGAIVWWSFQGVEIARADLVALVKAAGLDEKIVPTPEPRGALKEAVESLHLQGFRLGRHKVSEDKFALSFDVAQVSQQGGPVSDVSYRVEQVVEYDYTKKALTFKSTYMEQEIRDGFKKYLTTLQSHDLRTVVMHALVSTHTISVRERGGVYFVPRPGLDTVQKLRDLAAKIPGAEINRLRIADEPEERADMLKSAGSEIEAEIAAAELEFQEIAEKAKGGKVRDDTLERRIASYKAISAKGLAYSDLLGFKRDAVEDRLKKLRESAQLLLDM